MAQKQDGREALMDVELQITMTIKRVNNVFLKHNKILLFTATCKENYYYTN